MLKKIVDGQQRPIWYPSAEAGMAAGAPATLLGYPVYINNDMSSAVITGTRADSLRGAPEIPDSGGAGHHVAQT